MAENTTFYLNWTLPNWITVLIMVGVGVTLFGLVSSGIGAVLGTGNQDQ